MTTKLSQKKLRAEFKVVQELSKKFFGAPRKSVKAPEPKFIKTHARQVPRLCRKNDSRVKHDH